MKKILCGVLSLLLTLSCFTAFSALPASAETGGESEYNKVLIDEDFDEYQAGTGPQKTRLADLFVTDAVPIGDSFIVVEEGNDNNLYLRSRIFTQTYTSSPVEGNYRFSLDVLHMDGSRSCGIFIRAPKNHVPYYEGDGDSQYSLSCSHSGIFFYVEGNRLGVNIKTYNKSAVTNNTVFFDFPKTERKSNGAVPLCIEDEGDTINVYVGDTLICMMMFAEPTKRYRAISIEDYCFAEASLYNATGDLVAEYTNTLVMANGSILGWATRVADLKLDSIYIAVVSEDDAPAEEGIDVDTLPDSCPGVKPAAETPVKNRLYPWLTAKTQTYTYNFTSSDIKTYSSDTNLATAGLRTGMKFTDGMLTCAAGKTFSFGSGVFLGDDYGITGGTFGFDMDLSAGIVSAGVRLSLPAATNAKRGIWFTFNGSKLTVSEPESGLRCTVECQVAAARYEIKDEIDRITLTAGGKTLLYLTYGYGGAIHVYTPEGTWLAGTDASAVGAAGYCTLCVKSADVSIDNLTFTHTEITYTTDLSAYSGRTVDYSLWTATDDLQRTVTDAETAGDVRDDKNIGVFYFIALSGIDSEKVQDTTKLYMELGAEGMKKYFEAGQSGNYYWAEPYFGYYRNVDTWVYRKHAYMLEAAGADFIYIDLTNGAYYEEALYALFDTWLEMRHEGNMTPGIVIFAGNGGNAVNSSLDGVRGTVYSPENIDKYSELFYYYDGKPLILLGNDEELTETNREFLKDFTYKTCWAWMNEPGMWNWIQEYEIDERGKVKHTVGGPGMDENGKLEELALMIAHHASRSKGRSYANGVYPDTSAEDFGFSLDSGAGLGLAAQWEAVKKLDPRVILFCGWNEWMASIYYNGVYDTFEVMGGTHVNGYGFIDQFDPEYSRDAEPMKLRDGQYTFSFGDNYYYQMCSVIREYKGMNAASSASGERTVDIRKTADWDNVGPAYNDTVGDTAFRSEQGYYAGITYVNNTGRNDFDSAKVTQDEKYLYFTVKCVHDIVRDDGRNWMNLFINCNGNASDGWEGFDFVLNRARDEWYVSVESLADGWSVTHIGQALYTVDGQYMTVRLDKSVLGITGEITDFTFKWADNSTATGNVMEFMDIGDTAPNDRFAYVYNGRQAEAVEVVYTLTNADGSPEPLRDEHTCLPGYAASEVETETDAADTKPGTETGAEGTQAESVTSALIDENSSETDAASGGCTSAAVLPCSLFTFVSVLALKKRKKRNG